jgi:hypothetical protein
MCEINMRRRNGDRMRGSPQTARVSFRQRRAGLPERWKGGTPAKPFLEVCE